MHLHERTIVMSESEYERMTWRFHTSEENRYEAWRDAGYNLRIVRSGPITKAWTRAVFVWWALTAKISAWRRG